ncbi:hypothetical protein MTR67_023554 [Solanum verrucosum]|uniref:Uncharacterized protein n=1 Tax=Solanum verrucosum TaxID=315347 RepID=A0AAF0R236_SOLVR|nr:hypothetical protein MTR67_023554 [Solanum verrucosum]
MNKTTPITTQTSYQ